jgi:tRNA(adenine34) deaminase
VDNTKTFEELIELALAEATVALEHHDVPVGALVIGPNGDVLASRHNERELTGDPMAHAEILVLRDAAEALGSWRLDDCTLVVTLEPCVMCAGAAQQSRIARVVYGAMDPKAGALGSLYNIGADPRFPHDYEVVMRVRESECAKPLIHFFSDKR